MLKKYFQYIISGLVAILLFVVIPLSFLTAGVKSAKADELVDLLESEAIQCLAKAIYHESKSEGYTGQLAVGMVVLNRTQSKHYPGTVCGVVYQGKMGTTQNGKNKKLSACQFSWACDGLPDVPKPGRLWDNAQAVAHTVYAMYRQGFDITKGATHFHATHVTPAWTRDRSITRVGQIDRHIFYRLEA